MTGDLVVPAWRMRAARVLEIMHIPMFFIYTLGWMPLWAYFVPRSQPTPSMLWIVGMVSSIFITLFLQLACRQCPITWAAAKLRGEYSGPKGLVARLYKKYGALRAWVIIGTFLGLASALLAIGCALS